MSYRIDVRRFISPAKFKGDPTGHSFTEMIKWLVDNISEATENGNNEYINNDGDVRSFYRVAGEGWSYESRVHKVNLGEDTPSEEHYDKIFSLKHTLYLSKFVHIDDPDLAVQFKLSF